MGVETRRFIPRAGSAHGTEAEKASAEQSEEGLARSGKFQKQIVTMILPAIHFWPAEEYHRKYYLKHSMAYRMYRFTSGRDSFLARIWGAAH
ncbi:MAG: peptide-methionine (S)-S-oxide reductase [Chthoniobacterales bacterium]